MTTTSKAPRTRRSVPYDGEQIRLRRMEAGFNQSTLGELARVSQTHIARLELNEGGVSAPVLARLAAVLDCEVRDLMAVKSA